MRFKAFFYAVLFNGHLKRMQFCNQTWNECTKVFCFDSKKKNTWNRFLLPLAIAACKEFFLRLNSPAIGPPKHKSLLLALPLNAHIMQKFVFFSSWFLFISQFLSAKVREWERGLRRNEKASIKNCAMRKKTLCSGRRDKKNMALNSAQKCNFSCSKIYLLDKERQENVAKNMSVAKF